MRDKQACGCTSNDREWLTMCPAHRAEHDAYAAAARSGCSVGAARDPASPTYCPEIPVGLPALLPASPTPGDWLEA